MADNVNKGGTSTKWNTLKCMRPSYDASFTNVVMKHAEQTTVKQQESIVASKADFQRWK